MISCNLIILYIILYNNTLTAESYTFHFIAIGEFFNSSIVGHMFFSLLHAKRIWILQWTFQFSHHHSLYSISTSILSCCLLISDCPRLRSVGFGCTESISLPFEGANFLTFAPGSCGLILFRGGLFQIQLTLFFTAVTLCKVAGTLNVQTLNHCS